MAESFSNKLTRAAGSITTKTGSTVAAGSTVITNASVTGIGASNLIVNSNYIAGTKVHSVTAVSGGIGTVYADRASTNTASATNQTVNFLGVTTAFTARIIYHFPVSATLRASLLNSKKSLVCSYFSSSRAIITSNRF